MIELFSYRHVMSVANDRAAMSSFYFSLILKVCLWHRARAPTWPVAMSQTASLPKIMIVKN